eukprot:1136633-Pelagomonas_calceolata.AAC.4
MTLNQESRCSARCQLLQTTSLLHPEPLHACTGDSNIQCRCMSVIPVPSLFALLYPEPLDVRTGAQQYD